MCRVESPVHPWLNFILRPVFSLPKPAQVTSVVLFNIGPVTPNRINGLFDSVRKPRCIPTRESFKPSEHPFYDTVGFGPQPFCEKIYNNLQHVNNSGMVRRDQSSRKNGLAFRKFANISIRAQRLARRILTGGVGVNTFAACSKTTIPSFTN